MEKVYAKWWRELKPSERKALVSAGYFDPLKPENGDPLDLRSRLNDTPVSFLPRDLEWHSDRFKLQLSDKSTFEQIVDTEEKKETDAFRLLISQRLKTILFFIIKRFEQSKDPSTRLDGEVLKIVIGEGNPPSQVQLAKTYKMTKQAVSIRCRTLLRQLGLETSLFMRPDDEVKVMRMSRLVRIYADGKAKPPHKESFSNPCKLGSRSRPRKNHAFLGRKPIP